MFWDLGLALEQRATLYESEPSHGLSRKEIENSLP